MKLSKLCLYLGLTLLGLLSFIPSGCCSNGPTSGGLADYSDPSAPKAIDSDNIRKFFLKFRHIGTIARPPGENSLPPFPVGDYLLEAEWKDDKAHFLLACDRPETTTPLIFQKDLPADALLELQGIIRKYNLPAINGSNLRNSALGTSLSFEVLYDTDERLSVYAEGGASTLPHGWCGTDVFLEFFLNKLDAEGLIIPPLYSCIYSRSNTKDGFLYSLELETDRNLPNKQAIFKETLPQRTADNPFGERVARHVTVPKEKLEAVEDIITRYHMRNWKDLPYRENAEGNADFISIVFNYSDGNNICLNSDQELPPDYQEAFESIHQALTEAAKAAPEE